MHKPPEELLEEIAEALAWISPPATFVGGATVSLHLDALGKAQFRPTDDVDCVVEVVTRADYYALEDQLRAHGLRNDVDGPTCRWLHGETKVDIMPVEASLLGFSALWYADALARAEDHRLPGGRTIRVFSAAWLFVCKIEAYRDRGRNDPYTSKDFEDLVALLDGYATLEAHLLALPDGARRYVAEWCSGVTDQRRRTTKALTNAVPWIRASRIRRPGGPWRRQPA